jgi:hypothetical protein
MATPKIQVFGANLNPKDGHTPVKGVDYWTEEDKQEIVSETTAALEKSMPIVPDWAQAETKPEYKYEEIKDKPTLVEGVGASLNEETNVLTIEVKDKAGNVIASTTVALPSGGSEVDLTNYYTKEDVNGGFVATTEKLSWLAGQTIVYAAHLDGSGNPTNSFVRVGNLLDDGIPRYYAKKIRTDTPIDDEHCANKKYVDDLIAQLKTDNSLK